MSSDFDIGQRLGDYEILGVLGAGGMGKVYKVRNVISDRIEAMKVLLANLAVQKELADRFLREIKLLASLDHPNIAALRTALTLDNQLVMIMEYVEGVTLASRLLQGTIPPADAVNYTGQVLGALSYAHRLNVIHRDVKPANMMLTPQGVVKLMDFGIARPNDKASMTVTGTTLGSLNYMSPEQVKGEPVDARSDLYSLGVSLYEMVTGKLPFRGPSDYSLMAAHLQEPPQPPIALRPDLPKGLSDIILMAMAKEPKDRFQSAEACQNALKSVLTSLGIPAAIPVPAVRATGAALSSAAPPLAVASVESRPSVAAPPPSSRRGLYMALGGLIVVGILAAAAFYVPRRIGTQANTSPANSSSSSQTVTEPVVAPAPTPLSEPALSPAPSPTPAATSQDNSAAAQEKLAAAKKAQEEADAKAAEEAKQKAAELADAERQSDQLASRAAAISQSLDNLQRAQSAQGFGLRGDIVQSQARMQTSLSRAQAALEEKDGAKAKPFLDAAEVEASKLERFLGR
ncbi:MAG: protein kinase [Acidobacteriia bacterium]|nr:protein kinase [Terriglobia bacterium]